MSVPGPAYEPPGRPTPPKRPALIPRAVAGIAAAVEPIAARALGLPRIAMAHAVVRRYSTAGGPVLARGLAFVALFALVPAVLVILAIVGAFVADPVVRAEIEDVLAAQLPPLAPVLAEGLAGFAGLAPATGLVGALLLTWSASSLVRALDEAFRVVFADDREGRSPIRGAVAVVAVACGTLAVAVVLVLLTLPATVGLAIGVPGSLARGAGSLAGVTGLVALSYRFVPRPRPAWQVVWSPAVATGVAIFLLTALFGILGPLLFGWAQLYGAFGALFLGLVWLGSATQVLLLGAAWVAERDRRVHGAEPGQREGAPGR